MERWRVIEFLQNMTQSFQMSFSEYRMFFFEYVVISNAFKKIFINLAMSTYITMNIARVCRFILLTPRCSAHPSFMWISE